MDFSHINPFVPRTFIEFSSSAQQLEVDISLRLQSPELNNLINFINKLQSSRYSFTSAFDHVSIILNLLTCLLKQWCTAATAINIIRLLVPSNNSSSILNSVWPRLPRCGCHKLWYEQSMAPKCPVTCQNVREKTNL